MTTTTAPTPAHPVASTPTLLQLIRDEWKGFGSDKSRDWDWYVLHSGLGRTLAAFKHFDGRAIDEKLWANVGTHDAQWPGGFSPGHEDREAVALYFRDAFASLKITADWGQFKREVLSGLYYRGLISQMRKLHEAVTWPQTDGRQRHMDRISSALFGDSVEFARPNETLGDYFACVRIAGDEAIKCLDDEPEVFTAQAYWTAFQTEITK